jgi:hypothetical protein
MADNVVRFPPRVPPYLGDLYRAVLHSIHKSPPESAEHLASTVGASVAMVTAVVDCLISQGFAVKGGGVA